MAYGVNALVGIPNLSWVVRYATMNAALAVISSGAFTLLRLPTPRWIWLYLLVTVVILATLFVADIVHHPQRPDSEYATTFSELVFIGTHCQHLGVMALTATVMFLRVGRQEENDLARLRWGVIGFATATGAAYPLPG